MEQVMQPTTELDIMARVIGPRDPNLPAAAAQAILALRFDDADVCRMNELAEKNNQGSLSPLESAVLDRYLRVGQFLDLLQAKARLSLKNHSGSH